MASVQNKSLAELESMKQNLIAEGKTLSTSKELGKIENAIKVLRPENYGREAVASATEQLKMSTEPLTQQQLGIAPIPSTAGGRAGTTGTSPAGTLDLNAMYETAMGGEIADIEKQITDKQSALTQAMANINDNPYYSEATRTGQLAKLQDRANTEIQTLQNQLTMKKADLQTQLNIATQQYNIQSQEYQNNLNRLNLLISTGAIAGASAEDIAQISEATGMGTSMVQSIISKVNEGNRNLQTSTDNAGNVTIFDANTGAIVNRISGIGKASTSSTKEDEIKPLKDTDVAKAREILSIYDVATAKTEDKALSQQEIIDAQTELANEIGNPELAVELITEAMNRFNYTIWQP